MEYIIAGDTERNSNCLVCVCGRLLSNAESTLYRMKNEPNDNDKQLIEGHKNLRIKEVEDRDCWWNENCD